MGVAGEERNLKDASQMGMHALVVRYWMGLHFCWDDASAVVEEKHKTIIKLMMLALKKVL